MRRADADGRCCLFVVIVVVVKMDGMDVFQVGAGWACRNVQVGWKLIGLLYVGSRLI